MILDDTTLKLEAVLGGAVATNQPQVHVNYLQWNNDGSESKPGNYRSTLNNTTDVIILPAPPSQGWVREIIRVFVYNKDTASVTVTIKTDNGSSESIMFAQTLSAGKTLCFERGVGMYVI